MTRAAPGRRAWRWLAAAGLLLLAGVHAAAGFTTAQVTVVTVDGASHTFAVEVAATEDTRRRGLMLRKTLAADAGMLFDFGRERRIAMWMKDTPLPLDMLFADARGRVLRVVADTEPFSLEVIPSGRPARYVLELNAGTAAARGITPGARLVVSDPDPRP